MLTEKRYGIILKLLDERRNITIPEIKEVLQISKSTIRRDLTALDHAGHLIKVFGGTVAATSVYNTADYNEALVKKNGIGAVM